jgi:hypothetical protein
MATKTTTTTVTTTTCDICGEVVDGELRKHSPATISSKSGKVVVNIEFCPVDTNMDICESCTKKALVQALEEWPGKSYRIL